MLTLSQLTPVCYVTDGGVLCIKCGDAAGLPTKDQMIEYSADEFAGNDGLYCDDCSAEIVEPYVEDEPEEEDEEVASEEEEIEATKPWKHLSGVCKDCGNGTLNNDLNPAFEEWQGNALACIDCHSTHIDIL
jgi:hypothetical protein